MKRIIVKRLITQKQKHMKTIMIEMNGFELTTLRLDREMAGCIRRVACSARELLRKDQVRRDAALCDQDFLALCERGAARLGILGARKEALLVIDPIYLIDAHTATCLVASSSGLSKNERMDVLQVLGFLAAILPIWVMMHEDASLQQILLHAAKHQPHVIILAELDPALRIQIETVFDQLALRTPMIWLPLALSGSELEAHIQRELSQIASAPLIPALVRYCDDSRQVIRDIGYVAFEDGRKQNLPPASENESEELTHEMEIFVRQVECATRNHAAARHYLRQVMITDRGGGGVQRELAYRALHSSHKIYWQRDHIYRWVGVLAHYLPGVDLAYLPPPAPPSTKLDFLAHISSAECQYAAAALQFHGFKPSWMPALQSVLERKFTGQNEEALLEETLILSGWSLLEQIAKAQVRVMSCALDPSSPWYTDGLPHRALHRSSQTYCDFWNLRRLRENPQVLRPVADAVVVGGMRSTATLPVVPHFRHFVQALETSSIPKAP